jgi:Right handed beta helix region
MNTIRCSLVGPCWLTALYFPAALLLSTLNFQPSTFAQGSLTPPGTPAPTMKTLDQVEARTIVNATNTPGDATNTFIISQPGSYYLTGNITGASGKHGISIQANDVTLDLNGFALISGGGGAFRGVNVPAAQTNFRIRNGSVRGWTDGGVRTDLATSTLAEKLLLANNVGATGLALGNGSAKDCVATGNATGFVVGNGAEIEDCAATANTTGFTANDRTQIIGCISTANTGVGFNCTSFVTLIDCTASRNGTSGSGGGIVVGGTCTVIRCNASRNIPSGVGITAGTGCTIADCTAGSNGLDGILADSGSTVRGCTAQANGNYGVEVTGNCHVIGNTCDQNNGGLYATGNGNRIEGNSINFNTGSTSGYGVYITGSSGNNLVIRNSARGNSTNYVIFGGNRYGTIVDVTGTGTGTVSGNSAPSTAGTTDPWANFAY